MEATQQHDHAAILWDLATHCTPQRTMRALAERLGMTVAGVRKWYSAGIPLERAQEIERWPECHLTLEQLCPHLEIRRLGGRPFVAAEQAASA